MAQRLFEGHDANEAERLFWAEFCRSAKALESQLNDNVQTLMAREQFIALGSPAIVTQGCEPG